MAGKPLHEIVDLDKTFFGGGDSITQEQLMYRNGLEAFIANHLLSDKRDAIFKRINLEGYVLKTAVVNSETYLAISNGIKRKRLSEHGKYGAAIVFTPFPKPGKENLMMAYYKNTYGRSGIETNAIAQEMVLTSSGLMGWNVATKGFDALSSPIVDKQSTGSAHIVYLPETVDRRIIRLGDDEKSEILILYAVQKNDPSGIPYDEANPDPVTSILKSSRLREKIRGSSSQKGEEFSQKVDRTSQVTLEAAAALAEYQLSNRGRLSDETKEKVRKVRDSIGDLTSFYFATNGELERYIQGAMELSREVYRRQLQDLNISDADVRRNILGILNMQNEIMLYHIATMYKIKEHKEREHRKDVSIPLLEMMVAAHQTSPAGSMSNIYLLSRPNPTREEILQHAAKSASILRDADLGKLQSGIDPEIITKLVERSHCDKNGASDLRFDGADYHLNPRCIQPLQEITYLKANQILSLIESVIGAVEGFCSQVLSEDLSRMVKLSPFRAMDAVSGGVGYDADVIKAFAEVSGLFPSGTIVDLKLRDTPGNIYYYGCTKSKDGRIERGSLRGIQTTLPGTREFPAIIDNEGYAIPLRESNRPGQLYERISNLGTGLNPHSIFLYNVIEGEEKRVTNNGKFNRDSFSATIKYMPPRFNGNGTH